MTVPHDTSAITEVVGHTSSTFIYAKREQITHMSGWAIAGITVGVIIAVVAAAVGLFMLWRAGWLRCKFGDKKQIRYQHVRETQD